MSTSDRELLELAAKAVGGIYDECGAISLDGGIDYVQWEPLDDDGDALRLAVNLSLMLDIYSDVQVGHDFACKLNITDAYYERDSCDSPGAASSQPHAGDPFAATRRAIARAAAEIGRSMS